MSAQQHPQFLDDPRMIELLDIARTLEISVMHEIDENGCTATAFYQYPDRVEILAKHTDVDIFTATHTVIGDAVDTIDDDDIDDESA